MRDDAFFIFAILHTVTSIKLAHELPIDRLDCGMRDRKRSKSNKKRKLPPKDKQYWEIEIQINLF